MAHADPPPDIYATEYVEALFDEMAGSYERVNYVTSFGFSLRWRRQMVRSLRLGPGQAAADLMTGMGECWPEALRAVGPAGRLVAVDLSAGMLAHAAKRRRRLGAGNVRILKEDVLRTSLPAGSFDAVLCGFGLKTLAPESWPLLAREVARLLRPGGRFACIEVSVPPGRALRAAYMAYLKVGIPTLGRLFLGNPDNYRMLGLYTERFGDARPLVRVFEAEGLRARFTSHFHGCATGVAGDKPLEPVGRA